MDINSVIVLITIEDIYIDIAKDVEARFNTSIYQLARPIEKIKNN